MLTIELMGPKALTFIDYVGWLNDHGPHGGEIFRFDHWEKDTSQNPNAQFLQFILKAQTHLSQPLDKHMFVRPKKPSRFDFSGQSKEQFEYQYKRDLHQYENWKPMFVGTWSESHRSYWFGSPEEKAIRIEKSRCKTLDDFIREATKQEIELFYHPEHEMI